MAGGEILMDCNLVDIEIFTDEYEDFPLCKPKIRNIRRQNKRKAFNKRKRIVTDYVGYKPSVGYFTDKNKEKYFKYPKNSKLQQYLKHRTSKCIRRIPLEELYGKGNIHRRCIDYWWELL